jgi:hypothetical protein
VFDGIGAGFGFSFVGARAGAVAGVAAIGVNLGIGGHRLTVSTRRAGFGAVESGSGGECGGFWEKGGVNGEERAGLVWQPEYVYCVFSGTVIAFGLGSK